MDYSRELKKRLAKAMANVDNLNLDIPYNEAYEYHLASEPFELLHNWIEYFGVLDGGEDLLKILKP